MNKSTSSIIAAALVVIAFNMTYFNLRPTAQEPSKNIELEKVLPVVGRAWTTFDGMGATMGFLVRDGENFKIVPYDSSSMADNPAFLPKYVTTVTYKNGQTVVYPISVDIIH